MVNKKASFSSGNEEDSTLETDVSKEFINFFVDELKNIYWAERQLVKLLNKMQKASTLAGLKDIFATHCITTQLQVERLEQVFESLGETCRARECAAIAGLIENVVNIIEETEKGTSLRDGYLIPAAQKIIQFEIATYEGLVDLARTLGNEDIIALLEETLSEEKETDETLTALAEGMINGTLKTAASM